MTTITFNTLKFANRLKDVGMDPRHAEALAEAQSEAMEVNLKDLVTCEYLDAKLADCKVDIVKWMFGISAGQAMFIIAFLKLFPSN
ncbi:MAG: DUF1640 domain-containing protein [Magnetococcales bacterium]|nr:DUF1640 domain-containing protein [Magnetococcales bacterium]